MRLWLAAALILSFSFVQQAHAECKQIYNIGGKLYAITLPDAYCKSL